MSSETPPPEKPSQPDQPGEGQPVDITKCGIYGEWAQSQELGRGVVRIRCSNPVCQHPDRLNISPQVIGSNTKHSRIPKDQMDEQMQGMANSAAESYGQKCPLRRNASDESISLN